MLSPCFTEMTWMDEFWRLNAVFLVILLSFSFQGKVKTKLHVSVFKRDASLLCPHNLEVKASQQTSAQ